MISIDVCTDLKIASNAEYVICKGKNKKDDVLLKFWKINIPVDDASTVSLQCRGHMTFSEIGHWGHLGKINKRIGTLNPWKIWKY